MNEHLDMTGDAKQQLQRAGLTDLDGFFAWTDGQRLDKPSLEPWRQRWRVQLGEGPDGRDGSIADEACASGKETFYLKRFDRPPWRRQWGRWREGHGRLSTAGVEWSNARALEQAGIAAAQAVAFGQRMRGWIEQRSFVLLREVRGISLEKWVPIWLAPPDEDRRWSGRRVLVDELARFIARFHGAGFVHRDLYLSHVFLCGPAGEDGSPDRSCPPRFALIDLQRVFRPRWRRRRWVVKDLAALNYSTPSDRVSRFERLRFLCRYARTCGRYGSARSLVGPVVRKTAWMARRR